MRMNMEEFYRDLPAIWLVFSGSYLNHSNKPTQDESLININKQLNDEVKEKLPDQCEKLLLDLFLLHLKTELSEITTTQSYNESDLGKLNAVYDLIKMWSEDLGFIYDIRQNAYSEEKLRLLTKRFSKRVQRFDNCTIIPNGLYFAEHTEKYESVNLAILKKNNDLIDWIQVNPGGLYHQHYKISFAGGKTDAFFEITDIDPNVITEEWLYLLIGLKSARPRESGDFFYKEMSMYECLLSHLNGKTLFKTVFDDGFLFPNHSSPTHTWQVIEQALRYLLHHFLGEEYSTIYKKIVTGFKLYLMEKTFRAYQDKNNKQVKQCDFLLQEMCQETAWQALNHGNPSQKDKAKTLIETVKNAIEKRYCKKYKNIFNQSLLKEPQIQSISFIPPRLIQYPKTSDETSSLGLTPDIIFTKPHEYIDIIDYLVEFQSNFVDKLAYSTEQRDVVLLSHGIEVFLVDYLANTDILGKSNSPFSKDDSYLGKSLKKFAEIYYCSQGKCVQTFLANLTYQPQFYAKNVIIQFFVYACVAALSLREENVRSVLDLYNLSTRINETLSFDTMSDNLVIDDERYLKILGDVKDFFKPKPYSETIYTSKFDFRTENDLVDNNIDVKFAYNLLQKDYDSYQKFKRDKQYLEEEKTNRKWADLTFSDAYLPSLYKCLSEVAFIAKTSLTGFPSSTNSNKVSMKWDYSYDQYWSSNMSFKIDGYYTRTHFNSNKLTNYTMFSTSSYTKDPYQHLVTNIRLEQDLTRSSHFLENEIIANQDKKPVCMDTVRYMYMGFLHSEPHIKFERLYIAIKEQQLDFSCVQESVIIKQTLFEQGKVIKYFDKSISLLEWTVLHNPLLVHKFGLLCIDKALGMKFRLTQHQAIGEILEVVLKLLTFYPKEFIIELIDGIENIFNMLKDTLKSPSDHLNGSTLVYLNAYLTISMSAKQILSETEVLALLKALLSIQNYKVEGITLNNNIQLQVYLTCFALSEQIGNHLIKNRFLLNHLLREVLTEWEMSNEWLGDDKQFLFTCGDYSIKPLIGTIYNKNRPVTGLPNEITQHRVFKDYLGNHGFAVIPDSHKIEDQDIACYLSVDRVPRLRLSLIKDLMLIEEWIEGSYQKYIPAGNLLGHSKCPRFLYELDDSKLPLRHWLHRNNEILIKNHLRQITYKWNLTDNFVFSLKNNGYVIPMDHIHEKFFKKWLKRIELLQWIEIIADGIVMNSPITMNSLHFLRLGLHFDYKDGKFFSRQIHSYCVAKQHCLNTLNGFSNYLIVEKEAYNSMHKLIKVIIPHRVIKPIRQFYNKTVSADLKSILYPPYFIYDYDKKIGLLKGNTISARFYLALLYYCAATLDENDSSQCNSFHLARENLDVCWKDQPYDEAELNVIEQFLSERAMRDFHCCRVALYLKVVSLLIDSLRLEFLYSDEQYLKLIKRSRNLLTECRKKYSKLVPLYFQNKLKILSRIRLSSKEELIIKNKFFKDEKENSMKSYNRIYEKLFSKNELINTYFLRLFMKEIEYFKFSLNDKKLNFATGIKGIILDKFCISYFMELYKIAISSKVNIIKYRYLLHHLILRPVDIKIFEIYFMLARALLLVSENPAKFPEPSTWFDSYDITYTLSNRSLSREEILRAMPTFYWIPTRHYDSYVEEERARENAREADDLENEKIWKYFKSYALDSQQVPLNLPSNQLNFSLIYENYVSFSNPEKKIIVRDIYLQAAQNDAMYQFFIKVLTLCDDLKLSSKVGWTTTSFEPKTISKINLKDESYSLPLFKAENLERFVTNHQPVIDITKYFKTVKLSMNKSDFLFESQLNENTNGYKETFYTELKDSWIHYRKNNTITYEWMNAYSLDELEHYLMKQYSQTQDEAKNVWNYIKTQFQKRPNSESDQYFALQWHSGQIEHYHKGNIIALLHEPQKIATYNPICLPQKENILQNIICYIVLEINAAKIVRALTCCEQYKQVKNESEKFSLLQSLAGILLESLDHMSYRHPHWLLFQLENDIIVRGNQCELISEMLQQNEKAMYQLNMGEGKSSVILPLLSNNLANGKQLLRINVLYPLLNTMKNFLRQRFSGLIRKRIYALPFYRDTDISRHNLALIVETLKTCCQDRHILLVTPEHRLCLQLKARELLLESQHQLGASDVFDWKTYRRRVHCYVSAYKDLTEDQTKDLLTKKDEKLKTCLQNENYIDSNNRILKVPPRGQGRKEFARFKDMINEPSFREWSCLKAAYRELLYNSTTALTDCSEKLTFFNEIDELPAIDLLDESDEILRHGTELNYTIGDKYVFDGGELRWHIPQFLIETVFCDPSLRAIIEAGKSEGFTVINEHYSPNGGVPFIQLLNETYYENNIKPLLINKFFSKHLPTLRKYGVTENNFIIEGESSSLKGYVSGLLSFSTEKRIAHFLNNKGQLRDELLIAKGWLSHGILYHVFNAKYRVQYGLYIDFKGQLMKPIAIPFWGKDAPSLRSEFSHPDVMLGFTIISYLYQGLNQQQLKETLIRLKDKFSHQVADAKLREWAHASQGWIKSQTDKFPPLILQSFENIDLADEQCTTKLHLFLSCNYPAVLFYLNQFVLLEEAMQYRQKISANAHSLVGYNAAMGFSGTDDRKLTMPFQVKSLRSVSQQGTNGKLLFVLTQERNSCYYSLQIDDTTDLLKKLCHYVETKPECHALFDAGALVTGMTNYEVSRYLLNNLPDIFQGVLYFCDEKNSLTVLTKENKTIALQDCYLDKQYLFAYLDDVHTRGTDIKLPLNCQAMLTIGMGMEKDKLMQAAMRLRQLALKQSVSLWGTQAVTLAIARDNKIDISQINSFEVIKWVTSNTIEHINKDLFPVALRKINFEFLKLAKLLLKEAPITLDTLIHCCQDQDLFHLDEFYSLLPQCEDLGDRLYWYVATQLKSFWQNLEEEFIHKHMKDTEFYRKTFDYASRKIFRRRLFEICREVEIFLQTGYVHNSLDNDQEKEVEVEIIQEQKVLVITEKRTAVKENIWDVELLKQTGFIDLAEKKNIIMPLHAIRHFIQMPDDLKNITWHSDIYMTSNYINSVECRPNEKLDNYLRPVDVVLLHRIDNKSTAILLSGQEAANIKSKLYTNLNNNVIVHLDDINGPTQLPVRSVVTEPEQKLFTIIKLFAGMCQYSSSKEVHRLAKRVGRLYPTIFTNSKASIDSDCSLAIYGTLIENGYLNFAGIMTEKLIAALNHMNKGESSVLQIESKYQQYCGHISKKLYGIYSRLIIETSSVPLKKSHYTLWKWIGTRGRLKYYPGSALESILNPEYEIKC